jgi:predicted DNA-binding transcriptional regulator AlpA
MHKPTDRIFLQPNLVLATRQVNVYDAMNLVAYAKVPLVSALRAGELIAGFILRKNEASTGVFLSQGQKDRLMDKYGSELARFRYPVAPSEYMMLQEKMLDAGETALPYFFHEHHELVHARRRASAMAQAHGRLGELVLSGQLILQLGDAQLSGFPISSSAWMSQKTLGAYLEGEGVSPWWEIQQNLESHRRLISIVMSDWINLSNLAGSESIDEAQLPSYIHARMLLQRTTRPSGYATPSNVEPSGPAPAQKTLRAGPGCVDELISSAESAFESGKNVDAEALDDAHDGPVAAHSSNAPERATPALPEAKASKPRRAIGTTRNHDSDRTDPEPPDPDKMISKKEVANLLGVSVGTVDNRGKLDPDFPRPARYSSNLVRWNKAAILEWKRKHEGK